MKSGKILFTSLLLLGLWANGAAAAQKGLILLGSLEQSMDLSYQFGRQDVSGGGRNVSSMQNRFQEVYNLETNFALYNERVFKSRLSGKAKAEQEYFSSSVTPSTDTKNFGFLYNFYGVVLERGYTPVKLTASSEQTRIQNSFSPGYDLNTTSYGVGTSVRNKILPIAIDYAKFSSETSGLAEDRIQSNDQIALSASHIVPGISQTDLLMYRVDTTSESTGGSTPTDSQHSFQASLRNSLSTRDNKYALITGLRVRDEMDRVKSSNFSWQESFSWRLGKALSMGLGYSNDSSKQEDENTGVSSTRTSNAGNFSLAHQLYKNLSTRLDLTGRNSELVNGTESEYSGALNVNYFRTLPRDGRFTLSYHHLRTLIDRNLNSDQADAIDEPMVARLLEDNLLDQPNVIEGIEIVVRDADPATGFRRYQEGLDYTVDRVTRAPFVRLEFGLNLPGSSITEGRNLLISYKYRVNPSIEYLTVTHSVATSISLAGKHRIYANFDKSDQELVSGRTDLLELNKAIGVKLGFNSEINRLVYGAENSYVDSTLDKHNATEGFARFTLIFPKSTLMGQVRDRYVMYGSTAANPESRAENSFSVTANYTRPVAHTGVLVLTGSFTDARGGRLVRDDAELAADYTWSYSKLFLKLTGKLNWRYLSGVTSLENYLTVEVKRYF